MMIPTELQKIAIYCAADQSHEARDLFTEELERGKVNLSYWKKLIKTTKYILNQDDAIVMSCSKREVTSILKEHPGYIAIPAETFIEQIVSGKRIF